MFCTSLVVHCTLSALTWPYLLLHVLAIFSKPQSNQSVGHDSLRIKGGGGVSPFVCPYILYCHYRNSNLPLSVRLISTHPQNKFSNVHSLSPCRTKTTLYCDIPHTLYKSYLQTSVCSAVLYTGLTLVLYTGLTLVQNSHSLVSSNGKKSKRARYPKYSDVEQGTFYLSYLHK